MTFEKYLHQAWTDHAEHPQRVADGFSEAKMRIESNEQLAQLAGLVSHVMGEHLGQWEKGVEMLTELKSHAKFLKGTESESILRRSVEALKIASGQKPSFEDFGISDQIRIYAVAASALSGKDIARAKELFDRALVLSRSGLEKKDPALRALAVTGNNLACALEEKKSRRPEETEFMILAAQTGREYWELAGTWLEVSRAEYRLAMTFIQSQDFVKALQHAEICLDLCQKNKAGEVDLFFAYEAIACAERAQNHREGFQKALKAAQGHFEKMDPKDQSWCEASLKKLI